MIASTQEIFDCAIAADVPARGYGVNFLCHRRRACHYTAHQTPISTRLSSGYSSPSVNDFRTHSGSSGSPLFGMPLVMDQR
jgi:hypothetical protein